MAHEKLLTILHISKLKTKKKLKLELKKFKKMLFTKIKTYLEFHLKKFIFNIYKTNNIFGLFNFLR